MQTQKISKKINYKCALLLGMMLLLIPRFGIAQINYQHFIWVGQIELSKKNYTQAIYDFNTAISAIMELVNVMYGIGREEKSLADTEVMRLSMESVILLLSPFVPHFAEEIWEILGHDSSILFQSWPSFRQDALLKDTLLIVVQVNGKLRSRFNVDSDTDENTIKKMALEDERVQKFIDNKPVKKVIVVKNKLVNIVI